MMLSTIQRFIRSESAGGLLLMGATVLALLVANSPASVAYSTLLHVSIGPALFGFDLGKPLHFWVNDGLMAVFFFLVGLELKREMIQGELADRRRAILPAFAAVGGMALPALIYLACAGSDPLIQRGWAIPTATDIAFALGVITLLGNRVPHGLKVFLVSLAIIDDIGAVLIIALFYSAGLSMAWLAASAACLVGLAVLNRRGVAHWLPYLMMSLLLWLTVLNSGIHATLAGVAAAFFIPLKAKDGSEPLRQLEESLHRPVAFAILPIFALCNAGVPLDGLSPAVVFEPAPLGILLGLTLGKQLGVFAFTLVAVRLKLGDLPDGIRWPQLHAVAMLCGIGFTMSLFIAGLAFEGHGAHLSATSRLSILLGSTVSAVAGYLLLARQSRAR